MSRNSDDNTHSLRPIRDVNSPWLIADETGRGIGYEEVRTRTWGLANAMRRCWPDVVEDDVVCIYSPNNVDYPIVIWAAHRLSLTVSCANPSYTEDELIYQLQVTKSKLLFIHPANVDIALKAAKKASLQERQIVSLMGVNYKLPSNGIPTIDQLIQEGILSPKSFEEKKLAPGENKTKGTTGKPKTVSIPHHAIIANVIQTAAYVRLDDAALSPDLARYRKGDVSLGVLPMFHIYGLILVMHFGLFAGPPPVVIPQFNFVEMLKSIVKYRITHLSLVSPQIVLFCKHPATKKIRFLALPLCACGSSSCVSPELTAQFRKVMPNLSFGQAYGMTETATLVTMVTLEHAKTGGVPGSAEQIVPNTKAKVLKPDGTLAGYNEPGELVVAGPQMALCYENNEAAKPLDGWVHTGDEVVIKKSGDVFIIDRLKELIKVRGFQVAPTELEGHLLDHSLVDDVGVIGLPDDYLGEIPLAFVALSPEAKKNGMDDIAIKRELAKSISDKKVNYKWLKGGIVFIDAIPKNPSGKILRRMLRDKAKNLTPEERGIVSSQKL